MSRSPSFPFSPSTMTPPPATIRRRPGPAPCAAGAKGPGPGLAAQLTDRLDEAVHVAGDARLAERQPAAVRVRRQIAVDARSAFPVEVDALPFFAKPRSSMTMGPMCAKLTEICIMSMSRGSGATRVGLAGGLRGGRVGEVRELPSPGYRPWACSCGRSGTRRRRRPSRGRTSGHAVFASSGEVTTSAPPVPPPQVEHIHRRKGVATYGEASTFSRSISPRRALAACG